MARIAVVNIDLGGHLGPALRLAGTLAQLGHRVAVWAPESKRDQVTALGCELVAHAPTALTTPWGGLPEFVVRQADACTECLPVLLEELLSRDIELVVHDCQAPWGRVAAEYLGLPRMVSNPIFPAWALSDAPTSNPLAPGARFAWGPPSATRGAVAEQTELRESILARWGIDLGDPGKTMFDVGDWSLSYTTSDVVGPAEPPAGWCLAGPLMDSRPRVAPTGRPVVYAALGTFHNRFKPAFAAIISALGRLDVEAVVSTGGSFEPEELGSHPANVTVHRFVDSRAVLARATVHVTHGGASSVHESLVAGVPMVCLPMGADQHRWAKRVVACGAGELGSFDPGQLSEAILRRLSDEEGRDRVRLLSKRLLSHPGPALVQGMVDEILTTETGRPKPGPAQTGPALRPRAARG